MKEKTAIHHPLSRRSPGVSLSSGRRQTGRKAFAPDQVLEKHPHSKVGELHNLPALGKKSAKRQGQGIGSGKGSHTSGRGQKGQKARGRVGILFEGTKSKKSFVKRLPLLRGKLIFKPKANKRIGVNLKSLNLLPSGSEVTDEVLIKAGIISSGKAKILGEGEIKVALLVKIPISRGASAKIIKAGGKVLTETINAGKSTKGH